jgi:hypothetical protein
MPKSSPGEARETLATSVISSVIALEKSENGSEESKAVRNLIVREVPDTESLEN